MSNIVFKGHVTSMDALFGMLRLNLVIARNTFNAVNRFVHRFPWVCITITIATSLIVSFVQISKARAERDSINKSMVQTQMKLDSYQSAFGNDYKK